MKNFLISQITNCDVLGQGIALKILGENKIKSVSGGLLTILLWLVSLAVAIFNITEFLSSNNPRVNEGTQIRNGSSIVNLSRKFLNFTISIAEYSYQVQLFPLKIKESSFISTKIQSIPTFNMSQEKIGEVVDCYGVEFMRELRLKYDLNYSNCVGNKIYNEYINIEGGFELKYFLEHKFTTDLCSAFDKENCHNTTFYESLGNYYSLSFIYNQIAPNMLSKNGYTSNLSLMTKSIDLSKDYVFEMVFTRHVLYTDPNILWSLYNKYNSDFFTVKVNMLEIGRNTDNPNLMSIFTEVSVDEKEILHIRSYLKVDEMLANFFSIYVILHSMTELLYNLLHYKYLEYKIMHNVYRIIPESNNIEIEKSAKKGFIRIPINSRTDVVDFNKNYDKDIHHYEKKKIDHDENKNVHHEENKVVNTVEDKNNNCEKNKNINNNDKENNNINSGNNIINNDNNVPNDNNNNSNMIISINNNCVAHTSSGEFNRFQLKLRNRYQHLNYVRYLYLYDFLPCLFNKKKNKKAHQYFKMEKVLIQDMDISNIIKNSIKTEQIIKIFLNDAQEDCFRLSINRLIDWSIKTKKMLKHFNLTSNNNEDINKIFNSYNKILVSHNILDKNIINYLNL